MLVISKDINIEKLSALYEKLSLPTSEQIDLELPTKMETNEFSLLFSLIQFVATWLRKDNSGILHLPIETEDQCKDLNSNEFAYPLIVMCWEKMIIGKNNLSLKKFLKNPSKDYFKQMDFFKLKLLYSVPIYCFDFDKSNRGFAKSLYSDEDTIFSEDGLSFNLFPAYQKVGSFNNSVFRNNISKDLDSITAIIHELFSNTHEHAKTDMDGNYLYPNIRAIQLKFHKKNLETYKKEYKNFKGFENYFYTDFSLGPQNELYLLEISIIDSGPGLVKRYTGLKNISELSSLEEVNYVKECLYRHNTSSDISISDTKGIGLDRVLQTLNNKGLVRIKTGRIDVVRDVKTITYRHHKDASQIELYDSFSNQNSNFETYPEVSGTLISIFYPLTFN